MTQACGKSGGACWMRQAPERLLVQGFRCIVNGYQSADPAQWEDAHRLFADELGLCLGNYAVESLWRFVETYKKWSLNHAEYHAVGCPFLCKEECVVLSLISAMQHQDGHCARYCLNHMVEPVGCGETEEQAFELGAGFLAAGQRLMPVPLCVIQDITRTGQATVH